MLYPVLWPSCHRLGSPACRPCPCHARQSPSYCCSVEGLGSWPPKNHLPPLHRCKVSSMSAYAESAVSKLGLSPTPGGKAQCRWTLPKGSFRYGPEPLRQTCLACHISERICGETAHIGLTHVNLSNLTSTVALRPARYFPATLQAHHFRHRLPGGRPHTPQRCTSCWSSSASRCPHGTPPPHSPLPCTASTPPPPGRRTRTPQGPPQALGAGRHCAARLFI